MKTQRKEKTSAGIAILANTLYAETWYGIKPEHCIHSFEGTFGEKLNQCAVCNTKATNHSNL